MQKEDQGYLGQIFLSNGYISEEDLYLNLSRQLKIPFLRLGTFSNDKNLLKLFTESQIRTHKIFPLFKLNQSISIAVSDPLDATPINFAREVSGLKVEPIIAYASEIESSIDLHYGISSFIGIDSESDTAKKITDYFDETKVVELVDSIIAQSQKYSCSDIHIEQEKMISEYDSELMVTSGFSILTNDIHTALVSRLKIMANMDIAETRRPQDGRILFKSTMGRLDLRISTYPTLYGEKIVLSY